MKFNINDSFGLQMKIVLIIIIRIMDEEMDNEMWVGGTCENEGN
jgi:hypothetical protein